MTAYNKDRLVVEVLGGKTLIKVSREWAGDVIGYYLRDGGQVIKVNGKSFNTAVAELNAISQRNPKIGIARGYPRVKIAKGIKWQFCTEYSAFDMTKIGV